MEPNMQPQKPVQAAIEDLQKQHSGPLGRRERFFNKLKQKYPNFHTFYVFFNILAIWTGCFTILEFWAGGLNILAEPTPQFSPEASMRYFSLLVLGLLLLLLDDFSLKELLFGRKTPSEKPVEEMNFREKVFHIFKTKYGTLSTMYTLVAIILCWCGVWGSFYKLPVQPFVRAVISIVGGFFLLYIDDLRLDEL